MKDLLLLRVAKQTVQRWIRRIRLYSFDNCWNAVLTLNSGKALLLCPQNRWIALPTMSLCCCSDDRSIWLTSEATWKDLPFISVNIYVLLYSVFYIYHVSQLSITANWGTIFLLLYLVASWQSRQVVISFHKCMYDAIAITTSILDVVCLEVFLLICNPPPLRKSPTSVNGQHSCIHITCPNRLHFLYLMISLSETGFYILPCIPSMVTWSWQFIMKGHPYQQYLNARIRYLGPFVGVNLNLWLTVYIAVIVQTCT